MRNTSLLISSNFSKGGRQGREQQRSGHTNVSVNNNIEVRKALVTDDGTPSIVVSCVDNEERLVLDQGQTRTTSTKPPQSFTSSLIHRGNHRNKGSQRLSGSGTSSSHFAATSMSPSKSPKPGSSGTGVASSSIVTPPNIVYASRSSNNNSTTALLSTRHYPHPHAQQDKKLFVKLVFATVIVIVFVQIYIFATVTTQTAPFDSLTQENQKREVLNPRGENNKKKTLTSAIDESHLNNVVGGGQRTPTSTRGAMKQLRKKQQELQQEIHEEEQRLDQGSTTETLPEHSHKQKMDETMLKSIQNAIDKCRNETNGTKLNLSNFGLTSLESSTMDLILELKDTLELLNLGGNSLSTLPDTLEEFHKLRILFFSDNRFTTVPKVIAKLSSLFMISFKSNFVSDIPENVVPSTVEWLIMTDNKLRQLPNSLGKLTKLRKLMLAGNMLSELPETMSKCQSLELVRLSSNQLVSLPDWFLKLPNLTWLAAGGNPSLLPAAPMSSVLENDTTNDKETDDSSKDVIRQIPSSELTIHEVIGEGASGVVYKADWTQASGEQKEENVAVKVFKGDMTSDGLPMDELRSTLQLAEFIAAEHAKDGTESTLNEDYPITPVLGVIGRGSSITSNVGASSSDTISLTAGGLVMQLIDSKYKLLGGPPSFDTITRDTFDKSPHYPNKLSPGVACDLSRQLTHAIMELHASHLTHGDIYAHNLLASIPDQQSALVTSDDKVSVRLCDLGASTYVGPVTGVSNTLSENLKAFELRALGKFIDDLLVHLVVEREDDSIDKESGNNSILRHKLEDARTILFASALLFQKAEEWPQEKMESILNKQSSTPPTSTMDALQRIYELLRINS